MSKLADKVRELDEAANTSCPPCESVSKNSWVCAVQPCGPHCEYPYTDERAPPCNSCQRRGQARLDIRDVFGPTALAAVEALEAVTDEAFTCIRGDEGYDHDKPEDGCELCMARAVLRSWEQALGIGEEQSDGS